MTRMQKLCSKRLAAFVMLGAMLAALAAPQASAAAKKTTKTTSALKTESYTVTDPEGVDESVSVTETVSYQIGGKTITVKRSETEPADSSGRVFTRECTDTYTLSQPLKAMERIDDGTAAWDVPAGTKVTMIRSTIVYENGKVCEQDTWESSYVEYYVTNRIFSRQEISSGVADDAWLNSDDMERVFDESITVEKGKLYQMMETGESWTDPRPGNFVFRGV